MNNYVGTISFWNLPIIRNIYMGWITVTLYLLTLEVVIANSNFNFKWFST